jgi:hypothetical protein
VLTPSGVTRANKEAFIFRFFVYESRADSLLRVGDSKRRCKP